MASNLLHAQGLCRGCGERYQFIVGADSGTRPGDTVETNTYCQCEGPQENVVAVLYEPDLYDLVDTYGDGDIGLRATCEGCGYDYYGPVTECHKPDCEGEAFDYWLESAEVDDAE